MGEDGGVEVREGEESQGQAKQWLEWHLAQTLVTESAQQHKRHQPSRNAAPSTWALLRPRTPHRMIHRLASSIVRHRLGVVQGDR